VVVKHIGNARRSLVNGKTRPSPFLVVPGSSLSVPAPLKSIWRHSSGSNSLIVRGDRRDWRGPANAHEWR
jgi:hypothetical protein